MATELTPTVRDLIATRDHLRANADGARRMAERFDAQADELNTRIEGEA